MRILGIVIVGLLSFAASFLLALHVHFPGERVRDRLAWEVQEASKGAWLLQATDSHPFGLTGLSLEDAVLFRGTKAKSRRSTDAEPPAATPVLRVEELGLKFLLLPLLRGERAAGFRAELYGGVIKGELGLKEASYRLELVGRDLDLSRIPLEGEQWSIDAGGMLRLDGDLFLSTADVKESKGQLELQIEELVFKEASIMGMTLQPTPFTEAVLQFKVEEGRARVEKGSFKSEPVEIVVGGEIILNKDPIKSRLKLELEVRLAEEFDRLAQMAPDLKAARDEDGLYHFRVTGTLDSPRFREERQSRRSRPVPSRSPRLDGEDGPLAIPGLEGEDADIDAEARREARRERIKDRRKKMLDRREQGGEPGAAGGIVGPEPMGPDGLPPDDMPLGDEEFFPPEDLGQQEQGPVDEELPPEGEPVEEEY